MSLHTTSSQTVGPFFSIGLTPLVTSIVAGPDVPGEHVIIRGCVLDGDGTPVPDVMLETWQADAAGHYSQGDNTQQASSASGFSGFGRVPTDEQGQFTLSTIKPGRVPGPGDSLQAPHLVVLVFMRGLLKHLVTRMYFPGEPGNDEDPILHLVPPERRVTLMARRSEEDASVLLWDVIVQGADETVFFDA